MKKQFIKVTNAVKAMDKIEKLKKLKNTLSEDGQTLLDEITEAMNALLEDPEVEYNVDAIKDEILKIVNKNDEVPEAVANAIAEKFVKLQNSMPASEKLTPAIKNEIAKAILNNKAADIKDAVKAVCVKNDITGLSFNDVIDFAVADNFGDENPLFKQLYKTPITKFFYTEADYANAAQFAKQWDKSSETEKAIQQLEVTGKQIATKYIYKRQRVAQEDLDLIAEAGAETTFLRWINEELDRQIVNLIVMAILVGDFVNTGSNVVTSFEAIGTKTATDAFTTVANPLGAAPELKDFRLLADKVANPYGYKKVLVTSQSELTAISEFVYASGGDITYLDKAVIAGQIGVDEIYVTDLIDATRDGVHGIVLIPEAYWVKERNTIAVTYPTYERNEINYQKERNIGGAIHDLKSTAVLREA
jgi:hypothetical protein